jgi:beta-phosphoglucomutase-like phosphatase (HAD superfamily)
VTDEHRWPAAALFDLDGTLVDREPLMTEAVVRVIARAQLPAAAGAAESYVGRSWPDVYVGLAVAEPTGWTFDGFMDEVDAAADALVADGFPVRVLVGGRALMDRLADAGVPIAVVTGSRPVEVAPALELAGVGHLVSLVVAAGDYAAGKPDPACYRLAARRLGVAPEDCVVFEDSRAGVAAGRAAAMYVVATADANPPIGHPAHQDLSGAHVVVPTLGHVTDELLRRIG